MWQLEDSTMGPFIVAWAPTTTVAFRTRTVWQSEILAERRRRISQAQPEPGPTHLSIQESLRAYL